MKNLLKKIKKDPLLKQMMGPLTNSLVDGVFTLDSNGEITSWSAAMERTTGFTEDEAVGQTCNFLSFSNCPGISGPEDSGKCRLMQEEESGAMECFLKHKHGHDIPIIKNTIPVKDEQGVVVGILEAITDLTEIEKARDEIQEAALRMGEMHKLDNIIGKSQGMQQVFTSIRAAAASDVTVLIQGESGTGKELVAGAIHFNSNRANNPFVIVNCSALSESLLESELFGHIKGSFTGAINDRVGRLEEADTGTIFLDEIGDLSPLIQVKLLRALQEKEIERIGESKKRKLDIRILTATHKNLYQLVQDGLFREDLYYRLKVFPINIPPLRDRKIDIPLLASHFIDKQNSKTGKNIKNIAPAAMHMLMDHTWPGNVRELEHAIEHVFVLCNTKTASPAYLPLEIRESGYGSISMESPAPLKPELPVRKSPLTKELLVEHLYLCDWNKAKAARNLGVSRTAVWKRMKQWEIPLKQPDPDIL
ncbi:MAG: sigma 54-interacting transcriptional regulator [Desulfobacteraceae bacterium]|nr:sigma 54-interacting transcriptional regulator [Desulfobacteraceae bacterium]